MADDFCRFFDAMMAKYTLMSRTRQNYYHASAMQKNEVTPVMILFHASDCRCIKHLYAVKACRHLCRLFPKPCLINVFVRLSASSLLFFLGVARYAFGKNDSLPVQHPNKTSPVFYVRLG